LKNNYADGVIEVLALFGELLGFEQAPKPFQLRHHHIWGVVDKTLPGTIQMGPMVLYSMVNNSLKMIRTPISNMDQAALQRLVKISNNEAKADLEGQAVLAELKKMVGKNI
jgi:hypothetical protein